MALVLKRRRQRLLKHSEGGVSNMALLLSRVSLPSESVAHVVKYVQLNDFTLLNEF